MDHPDRPSAGRSWGELVRTPLLDRVGGQGGQEPGLAMVKDPRAGTAARPGLSTPPAPGAGPLQVGKRQGVPRDLFRRAPLPACHTTAVASRNRTGRMAG